MRPYIGITGFMSREEVEAMLALMPENCERLLMIGVLASQRTLHGEPPKRPNRNPQKVDIGKIFPDSSIQTSNNRTTLNLIHYNTQSVAHLAEQLFWMMHPNCDGFQLNIAWPSQWELIKFLDNYSYSTNIVLQVGGRALRELECSPRQLANKIMEYSRLADYVLLDMSGGLGKPLDADTLRPHLEALRLAMPNLGLGVAGGLSAETLHLVEPLIRDFPDISIDAEGLLRDSEDRLDLAKAGEYLRRALELFDKHGR